MDVISNTCPNATNSTTINPKYTKAEVARLLETSEASYVITTPELLDSLMAVIRSLSGEQRANLSEDKRIMIVGGLFICKLFVWLLDDNNPKKNPVLCSHLGIRHGI